MQNPPPSAQPVGHDPAQHGTQQLANPEGGDDETKLGWRELPLCTDAGQRKADHAASMPLPGECETRPTP